MYHVTLRKKCEADEFDCFEVFCFSFLHAGFRGIKKQMTVELQMGFFLFFTLCEEQVLKLSKHKIIYREIYLLWDPLEKSFVHTFHVKKR